MSTWQLELSYVSWIIRIKLAVLDQGADKDDELDIFNQ